MRVLMQFFSTRTTMTDIETRKEVIERTATTVALQFNEHHSSCSERGHGVSGFCSRSVAWSHGWCRSRRRLGGRGAEHSGVTQMDQAHLEDLSECPVGSSLKTLHLLITGQEEVGSVDLET